MKSRSDLAAALGAHVLMGPAWLVGAVGVGQALTMPQSMVWVLLDWVLIAALSAAWLTLDLMLVVWWRQGGGPMWPYPLLWVFALCLTFITLVGLLFPVVREFLTPRPVWNGEESAEERTMRPG